MLCTDTVRLQKSIGIERGERAKEIDEASSFKVILVTAVRFVFQQPLSQLPSILVNAKIFDLFPCAIQ